MKITELSTESNPVTIRAPSSPQQQLSYFSANSSQKLTKFQSILANISPETLWESYDEYCQEMTPRNWSTLDQKRLISMDYLSSRFMQLDHHDHTYSHSQPHPGLSDGMLSSLQGHEEVIDLLMITGERYT